METNKINRTYRGRRSDGSYYPIGRGVKEEARRLSIMSKKRLPAGHFFPGPDTFFVLHTFSGI
jgi:hypothetical protein